MNFMISTEFRMDYLRCGDSENEQEQKKMTLNNNILIFLHFYFEIFHLRILDSLWIFLRDTSLFQKSLCFISTLSFQNCSIVHFLVNIVIKKIPSVLIFNIINIVLHAWLEIFLYVKHNIQCLFTSKDNKSYMQQNSRVIKYRIS